VICSRPKNKTAMNVQSISQMANIWAEKQITNYIKKVSKVYNIPLEDLLNLNKESVEASSEKKKLAKLKKKELQELCKSKNLDSKGVKSVLIERLLNDAEEKNSGEKNETIEDSDALNVTQSSFGNYTYDKLVIDKQTKLVVGVEMEDGTIGPLTEDAIEKCYQYRLEFVLPENLDIVKNVVNTQNSQQVDDDEEDEEKDDEKNEEKDEDDEDEDDEEDEDEEIEFICEED
jgi:hypothetical protein